jgi:uncharacterized protein (DUF2141 family)
MKTSSMFNRLRSITTMALVALLAASTCLVPLASAQQGSHYSLTVVNSSVYDIEHVYFSPSDSNYWGPDQLGLYTIDSGHRFTFTNIRPGEYDIKFVDEDGDSCILRHQNVFQNLSWNLTTSWLLQCEFR